MYRPEDTTAAFRRARAEVVRMAGVLATQPVPHVTRALCVDCGTTVVLTRDGRCPCGSASVLPRRAA